MPKVSLCRNYYSVKSNLEKGISPPPIKQNNLVTKLKNKFASSENGCGILYLVKLFVGNGTFYYYVGQTKNLEKRKKLNHSLFDYARKTGDFSKFGSAFWICWKERTKEEYIVIGRFDVDELDEIENKTILFINGTPHRKRLLNKKLNIL